MLKYEKFIIGYEKEGRRIMEILGKALSEKTEAIYKDITEGLIYPIKIFKRSSFSCAFSFRKLTPMHEIGTHISNRRS